MVVVENASPFNVGKAVDVELLVSKHLQGGRAMPWSVRDPLNMSMILDIRKVGFPQLVSLH